MTNRERRSFVSARLPWASFKAAAESRDYASELTHPLYRYPAQMPPKLARALIVGLTRPGDLVLDPFAGGGTTAIEALTSGRAVICADLNPLACFVTKAKAWPVNVASLLAYESWRLAALSQAPRVSLDTFPVVARDGSKYAPRTLALLLRLRSMALAVENPGARRLALLTVLRVGQLCFDCRTTAPSPRMLFRTLEQISELFANRLKSYADMCRSFRWPGGLRRNFRVVQSDAEYLADNLGVARFKPVSLILTSPPYPGVHALYHRWQIYGRKETSLPYYLLGLNEGAFESHYTLGSRKRADVLYFGKLTAVFRSLRRLTTRSTIVAQVVGFSDPARQLPRFREAMEAAGFKEIAKPDSGAGVIQRIVPHRKWYAEMKGERHEFLVLHRPRL